MAIDIVKKTSTANTTAKSGRTIKYIVIHYTAGVTSKAGTAASTAAYFAKSTTNASADFIVDDETIVQFNPDIKNRYCWAVGGGKYSTSGGSLYGVAANNNSVSIEICSTNTQGKVTSANDKYWYFTEEAVAKARELTKYLMDELGIDAEHVIRHYDVTGKLCPGIVGWNADSGDESAWTAFKASLTKSTASVADEIDNTPDSWAAEAVRAAVDNGILYGNDEGNYKLHTECTRQEMIVFMYRLYLSVISGQWTIKE
ncbi:MAG: N-acetylmuramoyl-L-alanine amidase [Clostridia bacterium]|nr:N-acetylmuramoyl-L-alanine amidase [Clostridia bacterium]